MLDIKEEFLFDFKINTPRVLLTDKLAIVDSVKQILSFTEKCIIITSGKGWYAVINGTHLIMDSLFNERLTAFGQIESVEFHRDLED